MKIKSVGVIWVVLVVLGFPFSALAGDDANPGEIVINEFIANPAVVSDSNGEWVEIHNTTETAINIDGWALSDENSSHTIDAGGTLLVPANDKLTLCRNDDPDENGGVVCDYEYSSFTLTNSGGEIALADDGGEVIAQLIYPDGSHWDSPGQATYYLPSGNPPPGGYFSDNADTTQWGRTADASENLYGTSGSNYGTPGLENTQSGDAPTAIALISLNARTTSDFTLALAIASLVCIFILWQRIRT